ncbi:C40 family peptidase [Oceanobacillus jeddahense]|uniref:NlpC/P60 family protein n=1 Tax=Oceanobacillus jeddahense TaxID=1462527 RepID=A0ABY5JPA3_9BACI|nr:NlpC/P60 family protein [Oceanobacillus jeddahense]UUI01951.1 NlpC/P60 family protein [Oceanobacillus jeddahense]
MAPLNLNAKKYVISTAFATTLALTPVVGSSVLANAGEGSTEGDITYEESNLPEIQEEQSSSEEAPSATVNSSLIQQGDSGSDVENVQSSLHDHGYSSSNVDGIFGDLTEQDVRDFQSDQGLQEDGIVGPATSDALGTPVESTPSSEESSESESSEDGITIEEVDNSESDESTESNETDNDNVGPQDGGTENVSASNQAIVDAARSALGIPYQFGAYTPGESNPSALDSSGLINYTFDQVGIDVSRTHSEMWANDGVHVDSPSVGDVVFFEGTYDTAGASHSGIYIGNNQMIHASSGSGAMVVADMSVDYWQQHYLGAKSFN